MLFSFEIASKTVCTEHLQRAEKHEKAQLVVEFFARRYIFILLQFLVIDIEQMAAQFVGIAGRCLPEK